MAALTYTATEVESLRRSAAMAPLPTQNVLAALDDLKALHRERTEIRRLLGDLDPAWADLRARLNAVVAGGDS